MLLLKDGVILAGNKYTNEILRAVQEVYARYNSAVIVTAGRDGTHGEHSYHYTDRACDIRFWDIPPEKRRAVAAEIKTKLPAFYDVVFEIDHYHIEADAKRERQEG